MVCCHCVGLLLYHLSARAFIVVIFTIVVADYHQLVWEVAIVILDIFLHGRTADRSTRDQLKVWHTYGYFLASSGMLKDCYDEYYVLRMDQRIVALEHIS